jgi:HEAT repeat protein
MSKSCDLESLRNQIILLGDKNPRVRNDALVSLMNFADDDIVDISSLPHLVSLLTDDHSYIRSNATMAIGVLADKGIFDEFALKPLINGLNDEKSEVRINSAVSIGQLADKGKSDESSLESLSNLFIDKKHKVRETTLIVVKKMIEDGLYPDDHILKVFLNHVNDDDPDVRRYCICTISKLAKNGSINSSLYATLSNYLDDGNEIALCVSQIIKLISKQKNEDKINIAPLLNYYKNFITRQKIVDDQLSQTDVNIINSIVNFAENGIISKDLLSLLSDIRYFKDKEVCVKSRNAICSMAGSDEFDSSSIHLWMELLKDEDKNVQIASTMIIAKIEEEKTEKLNKVNLEKKRIEEEKTEKLNKVNLEKKRIEEEKINKVNLEKKRIEEEKINKLTKLMTRAEKTSQWFPGAKSIYQRAQTEIEKLQNNISVNIDHYDNSISTLYYLEKYKPNVEVEIEYLPDHLLVDQWDSIFLKIKNDGVCPIKINKLIIGMNINPFVPNPFQITDVEIINIDQTSQKEIVMGILSNKTGKVTIPLVINYVVPWDDESTLGYDHRFDLVLNVNQETVNQKCLSCGKNLEKDWKACPYCGQQGQMQEVAATTSHDNKNVDSNVKPLSYQYAQADVHNYPPIELKNSGIAMIMGFLLPGFGHIYCDKTFKGIMITLSFILLLIIGAVLGAFTLGLGLLYMVISILILDLVQIIDVKKTADHYNKVVKSTGRPPW